MQMIEGQDKLMEIRKQQKERRLNELEHSEVILFMHRDKGREVFPEPGVIWWDGEPRDDLEKEREFKFYPHVLRDDLNAYWGVVLPRVGMYIITEVRSQGPSTRAVIVSLKRCKPFSQMEMGRLKP